MRTAGIDFSLVAAAGTLENVAEDFARGLSLREWEIFVGNWVPVTDRCLFIEARDRVPEGERFYPDTEEFGDPAMVSRIARHAVYPETLRAIAATPYWDELWPTLERLTPERAAEIADIRSGLSDGEIGGEDGGPGLMIFVSPFSRGILVIRY